MLKREQIQKMIKSAAKVAEPLYDACLRHSVGAHPGLQDHLLLMAARRHAHLADVEFLKPNSETLSSYLNDIWLLVFFWQANLTPEARQEMTNHKTTNSLIKLSSQTYHELYSAIPMRTRSGYTLAELQRARGQNLLTNTGSDREFDTALDISQNFLLGSLYLVNSFK